MKLVILSLLLLLFIAFLEACSAIPPVKLSVNVIQNPEKIENFWTWFLSNEEKIANIKPQTALQLAIELSNELKKIDKRLTCEILKGDGEKKELVISANGSADVFPIVEYVVEEAPNLRKWKVVAFTQRVPKAILAGISLATMPIPGQKGSKLIVPVSSLRASAHPSKKFKGKADVTIFLQDPKPNSRQEDLTCSILQKAIGEYDSVMKLDKLTFEDIKKANCENSFPFAELAEKFDAALANH